jgi:ketosteroid isomerase-like protein
VSQENVNLVRHCYELLRRGDTIALVDLVGPEFELHENVLALDSAVYHGPDGLRKWLEVSREAFGEFRFEPERFIESGDWIFAPVHAYGRGRGSGAPFTAKYVTGFKLALGKIVFAASYQELPDALEAAGLSE